MGLRQMQKVRRHIGHDWMNLLELVIVVSLLEVKSTGAHNSDLDQFTRVD